MVDEKIISSLVTIFILIVVGMMFLPAMIMQTNEQSESLEASGNARSSLLKAIPFIFILIVKVLLWSESIQCAFCNCCCT